MNKEKCRYQGSRVDVVLCSNPGIANIFAKAIEFNTDEGKFISNENDDEFFISKDGEHLPVSDILEVTHQDCEKCLAHITVDEAGSETLDQEKVVMRIINTRKRKFEIFMGVRKSKPKKETMAISDNELNYYSDLLEKLKASKKDYQHFFVELLESVDNIYEESLLAKMFFKLQGITLDHEHAIKIFEEEIDKMAHELGKQ